MKIVELNESNKSSFMACLEEWSDEVMEAGDHRQCWCESMQNKGLGVKLALNDAGQAAGMIQYVPIEYAPALGDDLYFIHCIWVHGYKQGVGNNQKKGMGKALLQAAEEDVKGRGAKGIVAWGLALPFWMKAAWYKKQGYRKVDQLGFLGPVLLLKPFAKDVLPPRWIRVKKRPRRIPGQVTVTAFINGCCMAQNLVYERAKRAAKELGGRVVFNPVNTLNRDVLLEWGISDGLYIDEKPLRTGPPPTYQSIRKTIRKALRKL